MHIAWLQFAAGEMFVCFCVVLTIWVLATFGCLDFLVIFIRNDDVHLPTQPEQYRTMAVNISMQLGLAMIVYHALVYSVVKATVEKFSTWNAYEQHSGPRSPKSGDGSLSMSITATLRQGPTLMGGPFEFSQMRVYFIDTLEKYPRIKENLEEIEPLT